jgi:hypothetical protein
VISELKVTAEIRSNFVREYPQLPDYRFEIHAATNFHLELKATVVLSQDSAFAVSADIGGDNTTGVEIYMTAKRNGAALTQEVFLTSGDSAFTLSPLVFSEGTCTIDFEIISPPIHMHIGNVRLVEIENEDLPCNI